MRAKVKCDSVPLL